MEKNVGYLSVRAYQANEAIPVSNAKVTVYKRVQDKLNEIMSTKTNGSGVTEKIELLSRPVELSLQPSDIQPYSVYDVKVELEDFYTKYFVNLPIFSNRESIQKVPMVRVVKSADERNEIQYIIEREPRDL